MLFEIRYQLLRQFSPYPYSFMFLFRSAVKKTISTQFENFQTVLSLTNVQSAFSWSKFNSLCPPPPKKKSSKCVIFSKSFSKSVVTLLKSPRLLCRRLYSLLITVDAPETLRFEIIDCACNDVEYNLQIIKNNVS